MTPTKRVWRSVAAQRLLKFTNCHSVEQAVQVAARKVLEGVACPPTDLDAIKPKLNINQFLNEDMPVSGELRRDANGGFTIAVACYLSRERRRFTIAHEMGHAIFESTGPNCPYYGRELERMCDMLATEILMPRDSFLAVVKHEISVPKLKDVARLFQTSLSATGIRCSELLPIVAFEVEGQEVTWGSKMVTKGPVNRVDPKILRIINDAVRMTYGERELFMDSDDHHGKWKLEWEQIGNQKKTLFLLHPCLPTPAKPKTELVPAKRSSVVNAV